MTLAAFKGAKGFLFCLGEIWAEAGVVVVVLILISDNLSRLSLTVVVFDLKFIISKRIGVDQFGELCVKGGSPCYGVRHVNTLIRICPCGCSLPPLRMRRCPLQCQGQ